MAGVWDKTNCFFEKLLNLSRKIDKNDCFHEQNSSKIFQKIAQKGPLCGFNFFHLPGNFGSVNLPAANPRGKRKFKFCATLQISTVL